MNRRILNLAIPNIVSNITVPLLGIVDMALMGHLDSHSFIGAIAIGSLIFNFIYWGFSFLRMGTSGFTSQALGRRDLREVTNMLTLSTVIAVASGLSLILLQYPVEKLSFLIINAEPEVEQLAVQYFRIRIWAAPATLIQFAMMGWFLGMQNARIPMAIAITVNSVNIAGSMFFVMVLDMNSAGVALGTVIAQYCGLMLSLFFYRKYFSKLTRYISLAAAFTRKKVKAFMLINRDIFIRTICLVIVFSFFTAKSASADAGSDAEETILAVNSLLMQFFMFFSYLIDGYAHAAEALTGRFTGARDHRSLKTMIRLVFLWGTAGAALFTLTYLFAGDHLLRLLTSNEEVISNAVPYFFWVILVPLISFPAFLWDGIFIGATAGKEMRNAMIISSLLVFFPAYYLLQSLIGNHGLWLAFVLYMGSRSITMTLMAKSAIRSREPAS
jgi:multidrug resistance protein, MATE family